MNRSVALFTAAALSLGAYATAHAYSATADVTFNWAAGGTTIGWTSNGVNSFPDITIAGNDTEVATTPGNNSTAYYNPTYAIASDYTAATTDDCVTPPAMYETITLRKFACRVNDAENYYLPLYHPAPVDGVGPGASASGTLTVTDTTLTGTLTVISTTDQPTGGTTVLFQGVNIGTSTGDGADGFNVRTADGSPFGNAWYGITTTATLQVDLTGTFTATNWTIDGGAVTLSDAAFGCQQGGFGGDARGTLCTPSTTGGGFQPTGGHLSWGMDIDGSTSGGVTVATPIVVKDAGGAATLTTLSGVLAHLSLDVSGNITTDQGEFRYASGNAGGGCFDHIRWGGDTDPTVGESIGISCGTLSAGTLVITGTTGGGGVPDTTPDPFALVDQLNVALATPITSAAITVAGIDTASPISVSGDATSEYSIDGGAFTNVAGTVTVGQAVTVRHTSSATASTAVDTVLDIGTVTDTFTSTTGTGGIGDTIPDQFALVDQLNVALATPITSAAITVAGIDTASPISVSGDATSEYSIDGGAFTNVAGTVTVGQAVTVRHTSSATASTAVDTVLDIGTVTDTFTSTTGTGGIGDTIPDQFALVDQTNVDLTTPITSAAIVVAGIDTASPISVTGDATSEYSIDGGAFTNVAGTVTVGQSVTVRHTSSASAGTAVDTVLNIGTVTDTFTTTTLGGTDTIPDAFTLADQTDVALAQPITSAAITVAGIDTASPISVSGDPTSEYSINGGTFTSAAGTVTNGQTVTVRHTSSATVSTAVDTVLDIGTVTDTFTTTTQATDTTPDAFDLGGESDAALSTTVTSNTITVSGINAPATLALTGDDSSRCSVNGAAFAADCAATVSNGDTVAVQHTSAAANDADVTTTLTIGGMADTFTSTTESASTGQREDDGGSSLDALILALLGFTALIRRGR